MKCTHLRIILNQQRNLWRIIRNENGVIVGSISLKIEKRADINGKCK